LKKKNFAIWLIPCKKDKIKLNKMILSLSKKFKSPIFESHLTIYAGKSHQTKNILNNIKKIKLINIKLKSKKLSDKNDFFKSLFITTNINKDLNKLLNKLDKNLNLKIYLKDPHLSLMYKRLKKSKIKNIKKYLNNKIPKHIKFCQLTIVMPHKNKWKDIQRWKLY
jgi:Na+/phosphate symporter